MRPIAAVLLLAGCAQSTPAPIALVKPLDTLQFYVGNWTCKGTQYGAKVEHWDAKVIVAPELDGTWLSVQMIGPGTNRTIEQRATTPCASSTCTSRSASRARGAW